MARVNVFCKWLYIFMANMNESSGLQISVDKECFGVIQIPLAFN